MPAAACAVANPRSPPSAPVALYETAPSRVAPSESPPTARLGRSRFACLEPATSAAFSSHDGKPPRAKRTTAEHAASHLLRTPSALCATPPSRACRCAPRAPSHSCCASAQHVLGAFPQLRRLNRGRSARLEPATFGALSPRQVPARAAPESGSSSSTHDHALQPHMTTHSSCPILLAPAASTGTTPHDHALQLPAPACAFDSMAHSGKRCHSAIRRKKHKEAALRLPVQPSGCPSHPHGVATVACRPTVRRGCH